MRFIIFLDTPMYRQIHMIQHITLRKDNQCARPHTYGPISRSFNSSFFSSEIQAGSLETNPAAPVYPSNGRCLLGCQSLVATRGTCWIRRISGAIKANVMTFDKFQTVLSIGSEILLYNFFADVMLTCAKVNYTNVKCHDIWRTFIARGLHLWKHIYIPSPVYSCFFTDKSLPAITVAVRCCCKT